MVSDAGGHLGRATADRDGRYAEVASGRGRPYLLVVRAGGTSHGEHVGGDGPLVRDLDVDRLVTTPRSPAPVA